MSSNYILFSRPTPRKNIKNIENPPLPPTEVSDDDKTFSGSFSNYMATGIVMVLRAGPRATGSASTLAGPVGTLYARTHARTHGYCLYTTSLARAWDDAKTTRRSRGNVAGGMDRETGEWETSQTSQGSHRY